MSAITTTTTSSSILNAAIAELATPKHLIADILTYSDFSKGTATLAESIKAEVRELVQRSGVPASSAYKALKAEAIVAGLDPRRASEVFIELGFRERAAKKTAASKKEKDETLAPIIEALKALAKEKAGENAISALRRAYLSLQSESNS